MFFMGTSLSVSSMGSIAVITDFNTNIVDGVARCNFCMMKAPFVLPHGKVFSIPMG